MRVVKRLMAPDMWSGWGVRTLSTQNPAFNPYNYQTGLVWPHDNAIIALGFKRYGFGVEAARIARDISDAASHFLANQLPELYTTIERDEGSFPVQYLGANVPQAWAAGSVFALLQAILGFVPDAPRGEIARRSAAARVASRPDRVRPSGRRTLFRYPVLARGPQDVVRGFAGRPECDRAQQFRRKLLPARVCIARAAGCSRTHSVRKSPHRIRQACTRSIG